MPDRQVMGLLRQLESRLIELGIAEPRPLPSQAERIMEATMPELLLKREIEDAIC